MPDGRGAVGPGRSGCIGHTSRAEYRGPGCGWGYEAAAGQRRYGYRIFLLNGLDVSVLLVELW
jgi:hypothetical protein